MRFFLVEYAQFFNGRFANWVEVGVMTGREVAAWRQARGFRREDRGDTWMANRFGGEFDAVDYSSRDEERGTRNAFDR